MKFNIGGKASFFKILLNDSEDYLRLPAAFAEKYLEKHNRNKQVFLKTKSNVEWSVKYFKIEDGYYLVDGWLDFMKANRLHKRDFIVFWLDLSSSSSKSKLTFQVFPYAPNGCLKLKHKHPPISDDSGPKKVLAAVEEEEEESSTDTNEYSSGKILQQQSTNTMSVVVKKSYMYRLPLKRSFLEAKGVVAGNVRLKNVNGEGKTWEVAITRYQRQHMMARGWSEFRKHHNINIGNTCEFRRMKANLFHVRVVKKRGT